MNWAVEIGPIIALDCNQGFSEFMYNNIQTRADLHEYAQEGTE